MSAPRRRLVQGLTWISIALFVVLVLVVIWQVFTRQVLQAPSGWTTTVSQYLFIWLVLFSVAMVFGERGHVAVDFFARLMPRPAQRVTSVLVELSVLAFALLGLVWGGIRGMSISFDQAIPGLPVTVGQMYLALPIAGVLIALFALEDLVRAARGDDMLAGDDAQTEAALQSAGADAEGAPEDGRSSADGPTSASPTSPTEQKEA
ncbi:TRAP transporter small permease [Brachybacterium sp. GU-2]|uniref:TRAP transporter small permease n=1 Tax=Brachybacterium sp. GU-2 TaxID=3069708 RepID=UPI00280C0649|nr:TRAP transporter small permease [Brachybacterium sp. GU-2]WME23419.1 TRAP transporter small permease [Brachybacterium sp. GU-2]